MPLMHDEHEGGVPQCGYDGGETSPLIRNWCRELEILSVDNHGFRAR
jgi:hypothetical protein